MNSLNISPLAQYKQRNTNMTSQMSFHDKRPRFSPQHLSEFILVFILFLLFIYKFTNFNLFNLLKTFLNLKFKGKF